MKKSPFSIFKIGFAEVESFFSFDRLKRLYDVPDGLEWEDIKVLIKAASYKRYPAKSFVINAGDYNDNMYFIFKGLVRGFHVNDKGDEITAFLHKENQFFFGADTILLQQSSRFYYECLEPTYVGYLDFESVQLLLSAHRKLEETRRFIGRKIFSHSYDRMNSFVLLSPEERYLAFVEKYPDLSERVPNKYIANVLGITPVSLSRIRSRLAVKKR